MNSTARKKLCTTINQHPELSTELQNFKRHWKDSDCKYNIEMKLLTDAHIEQIPAQLSKISNETSSEVIIGKLTKQLQDNNGLSEEYAKWAVELGTCSEGN